MRHSIRNTLWSNICPYLLPTDLVCLASSFLLSVLSSAPVPWLPALPPCNADERSLPLRQVFHKAAQTLKASNPFSNEMVGLWLDSMILKVFSNLNDSMILWIYEAKISGEDEPVLGTETNSSLGVSHVFHFIGKSGCKCSQPLVMHWNSFWVSG